MSQELVKYDLKPQGSELSDLLAGFLRMARSVQRRKHVVVLAVLACMGLGVAYFLMADRIYASKAELFVLQTGSPTLQNENDMGQDVDDEMPNFERILLSDRVIKQTLRNLPADQRGDFVGVSPDKWVESFRDRLSVSTARMTNVMTVSYLSSDPEIAYHSVSAHLAAYREFMDLMHQDTSRVLLGILTTEKTTLENELRARQSELLNLRSSSLVLFGTQDQEVNVLNEQVVALNTLLIEAQKTTIDARTFYLTLDQAQASGQDIQQFAFQINPELATELLKKQAGVGPQDGYALGRMQQDLLEYQSELSSLQGQGYGPNHPRIRDMQNSIRVLQTWLSNMPQEMSESVDALNRTALGPRLMEMARQQYELAWQHENEIKIQYEQIRDEAISMNSEITQIHMAEADILRLQDNYNRMMDTIAQVSLGEQRGLQAEVITDPTINRIPVSPRLGSTFILCLIAGFTLGCCLVYVMDLIDDRFRSPDDLRNQLGAPILTMVRKLNPLAPHGLESLYPFSKPNSVESEAFRSLRTTLDFSGQDSRKLTISSTEPGDGKTTVFASLAVTFAQAGKRTLAIDGDMRRPGLSKLFELQGRHGLSSVLKEDRPVGESMKAYMHKTNLNNLFILPAGPRPHNPVELLSGDRLAEIIAWAETEFDQILIDAPPSLAVADTQVIGRLVDGAIMIVRPDKNRRKMVLRAAESLTQLGCRLLGIVINQVAKDSGDDYSYGYGYGYGAGYGHSADEHQEDGDAATTHRAAA